MSESTSTRYDVLRKVLLMIGERPVEIDESTTTVEKCLNCISNSLADIQGLADWTFLRTFAPANSWNNEEATLASSNKIYHISCNYPDGGSYVIPQIPVSDFYRMPVRPFQGLTYPSHFAVKDDVTILFNPYPETVEDQARIIFHFQVNLELPSLPGDVFKIPERFIPMLCYRTAYHMAMEHLADMETANAFMQLFGTQATVQLARDSTITPQNANMFRRRGHGYRWF